MKSINIVPTELFAVTDFHDVLVLKITEQIECPNFFKVKTVLNELAPSEHREFQHQEYFEEMYFSLDGKPRESCVFNELSKAKDYAKKNIREEIESKQREISTLEDQKKLIASL